MTKWLLACGAVAMAAYLAGPISAQEQIAPPQKLAVQSSETVTVMPARTLGWRIRERRGITTMTVQQAQMTTPGTTAQNPSISGVQQAQALETVPMTTAPTTMTTSSNVVERRGLFPRLRARMGRY